MTSTTHNRASTLHKTFSRLYKVLCPFYRIGGIKVHEYFSWNHNVISMFHFFSFWYRASIYLLVMSHFPFSIFVKAIMENPMQPQEVNSLNHCMLNNTTVIVVNKAYALIKLWKKIFCYIVHLVNIVWNKLSFYIRSVLERF